MPPRDVNLVRSFWLATRNRLLSGLLVLIPVAITWFVVSLIFSATIGAVVPVLTLFLGELPRWTVVLLSVATVLLVLYVAGTLVSHVAGRKLIGVGERIVQQIPVAKTVYTASKQVVGLFHQAPVERKKQIVLVEFPGPGLQTIGFVTGHILKPDGVACYKVFIPTTPNPTTGFFQIVPESKAQMLDLSAEDAIKIIMSGGVLAPDALCAATAQDSAPEKRD